MKKDFSGKSVNVFFITNDDVLEFRKTLHNDFVEICWGKSAIDVFSQKEAYTEFLARINNREESFKIGFIGELINHLFFQRFNNFEPISIFLSEGDRAPKRGFDLLHFDGESVWYTETKSGLAMDEVNDFNLAKLKEGFRDVSKKFSQEFKNKNHWNYAKTQVIKMANQSSRKKIQQILDSDYENMNINAIILATVVYGDFDDEITNFAELELLHNDYLKRFSQISFLCMRQRTYHEIIDIIEELNNGTI